MSPSTSSLEHVLLIVLIQLVAIIGAARIAGALFRHLGQPSVCGEIAAGLILGPSLFGRLFPDVSKAVFDPSVFPILGVVSQLGLVLLMFLIGLESDFGHLSGNRRTALSISITGMVLPFGLGLGLGHIMHAALGLTGSPLNFALFIATAMSITAIPVLGRILMELNLGRTRVGSLAISAAAFNDASGWVILAVVTAVVRAAFDPKRVLVMVAEVIGYGFFMFLVARPLLVSWTSAQMRRHKGRFSLNAFAALIVMVLISAAITARIGIFSIFGGFAMGAILFDQRHVRDVIHGQLHDFVSVFFLPIFFTYTGLRTDVGTVSGWMSWIFCGLVFLAAVIGKLGGCALAARACGMRWRESMMIGALMNTRGLMELIVINMGYDLGILPQSVFFMLVCMAVSTTYMTTPILTRLIRKSEAAEAYLGSQFAMARASVAS